MSIDVGWEVSVDGRVVSVDGGRLVSVNERVLLSIDAVHIFFFFLRIERPKYAGSENSSVCSLLLLVLLGMHLKYKKKTYQFFSTNKKPRLNLTK